jgi:tetratricopeptide (TPR) repeat protein
VLRLARSLDEGGEFEEAIALLESALGSLPQSETHPLKLALGHLQLKVNNRTGARQTFSEVFKAAPSEGVLLALARVLVLNGEFDTACGLYRQAVRLRPEDPSVLIALSKCLHETGDREAGEAILRAAARQDARAARLSVEALAATPHGRVFLRPSDAARFMGVEAV